MIKVSITGMVVSLKTDLRFPIPGQQGHEGRIIQIEDSRTHIKPNRTIIPILKSIVTRFYLRV